MKQKPISRREQEVIGLIVRGLSNKKIADELCIHEKTVKFHCTRIFRKCGVKTRLELASLLLKPIEKAPPNLPADKNSNVLPGGVDRCRLS